MTFVWEPAARGKVAGVLRSRYPEPGAYSRYRQSGTSVLTYRLLLNSTSSERRAGGSNLSSPTQPLQTRARGSRLPLKCAPQRAIKVRRWEKPANEEREVALRPPESGYRRTSWVRRPPGRQVNVWLTRAVYFSEALTLARYSAAFCRICASFSVRILASRTTGLPLTITSRTSSPFRA